MEAIPPGVRECLVGRRMAQVVRQRRWRRESNTRLRVVGQILREVLGEGQRRRSQCVGKGRWAGRKRRRSTGRPQDGGSGWRRMRLEVSGQGTWWSRQREIRRNDLGGLRRRVRLSRGPGARFGVVGGRRRGTRAIGARHFGAPLFHGVGPGRSRGRLRKAFGQRGVRVLPDNEQVGAPTASHLDPRFRDLGLGDAELRLALGALDDHRGAESLGGVQGARKIVNPGVGADLAPP